MSSQFVRQWWTGSSPGHLLQAENRLLTALVNHPFQKPRCTGHQGAQMKNDEHPRNEVNLVELNIFCFIHNKLIVAQLLE